MKTRNGFVSNSSSSSFVLGVKGNPTIEMFVSRFNVPKESPFYSLTEELAAEFIVRAKKATEKDYKEWTEDNYGYEDFMEHCKKNDLTIYYGYISDDGGRYWMRDIPIKIVDEEFYLIKDEH